MVVAADGEALGVLRIADPVKVTSRRRDRRTEAAGCAGADADWR